MEKNGTREAIVTSIHPTGRIALGDLALQFVPVACYAYAVGENTLNHAKSFYGL